MHEALPTDDEGMSLEALMLMDTSKDVKVQAYVFQGCFQSPLEVHGDLDGFSMIGKRKRRKTNNNKKSHLSSMKSICGTNMPVTLTLSLGGLCKKYGRKWYFQSISKHMKDKKVTSNRQHRFTKGKVH